MPARAFFYDKCNDASRLAAEWSSIVGALPTVTLDGNVFCYKWSGGIGERMRLMSTKFSDAYDLTLRWKKHLNTNPTYGGLWIGFSIRSSTDLYASYMWGPAGISHLYFYRGPVGFYCSTLNSGFTNDVWYQLKMRFQGNNILVKWWLYGIAEPDWIITNFTMSGGSEKPIKKTRSWGDYIGIGNMADDANAWVEISDIRITPIPRTGGP